MKMRIVFVVCALLLPILVHAQIKTNAPAKSDLQIIDSYAAGIDRFIKVNPKRVFGDMASADEAKSRWREFKTEAARQKAQTGDNLNQNAFVWTRKGTVVGANFTFTSPSGDWAQYVMHYFREDGTV